MSPKRSSREYRLQTVLETRRLTKQQAALELQLCRERLSEAQAKLAQLELELPANQSARRQVHENMTRAAALGLAAKRLVFFRSQLADLRKRAAELSRQIDRQRQLVFTAERGVNKGLQALFGADRELRICERHKELWTLNLRKEETQREQKASDEISLIMRRAKCAGV